MGLMLPRPTSRQSYIEWGSSSPSAFGPDKVTLTSVTAHVKTAWSELSAAVPFNCFGFSLNIQNTSASAAARLALLDIGIGAAGSEAPILSNVLCGGGGLNYPNNRNWKFFPLFIPAGARVAARYQCNVTAVAAHVGITFHGGGDFPLLPCFQRAEVIGADTATSGGTTHTVGTLAVLGSWGNIGSAITPQYSAIDCLMQSAADTAIAGLLLMEIGILSTSLGAWLFSTDGGEAFSWGFPDFPIYCRVPSGSQLQMRSLPNTNAGDSFGVGVIGYW